MDHPPGPPGLRKLGVADCNAFWEIYAARRPRLNLLRGNHFSRWRPVAGTTLFVALYVASGSVGLFVRGERGLSPKGAARLLSLHEPRLSDALGVVPVAHGCPYLSRLINTTADRSTWGAAQAWLVEREGFYHDTLARIVGGIDDAGDAVP